jgi:hypothetical protein
MFLPQWLDKLSYQYGMPVVICGILIAAALVYMVFSWMREKG